MKTVVSSKEGFRTVFFELTEAGLPPWQAIWALEPFETSERMTVQQGLFLLATHINVPFARILATVAHNSQWRLPLLRFEINPEDRLDILQELGTMNITEATLFPGIDGLARSLRTRAETGGLFEKAHSEWLVNACGDRPFKVRGGPRRRRQVPPKKAATLRK